MRVIKNVALSGMLAGVFAMGLLWAPPAKAAAAELHNCRIFSIPSDYGTRTFIVCDEGFWEV